MRKSQKGTSLIEALIGLVFFALVAMAPNCIGCKRDYSTGRRTGIIVKFSKKGKIKTKFKVSGKGTGASTKVKKVKVR